MQTSYAEQAKGFAGMRANNLDVDIISRLAENKLYFGKFAVQGTNADIQAKHPTAAADISTTGKRRGVVHHTHAIEQSDDGDDPSVKDKSSASIIEKGAILVEVEEAVTPASPVYIRHAGKKQIRTIIFDADLVTSNVINGKINSVSIAAVTFDTNHLTTMGLIKTEIEKMSNVVSATVGGSGNRQIAVLFAQDTTNTVTDFVVTLGASQAGVTYADTQAPVYLKERGAFRASVDNDETATATATIMSAAKYVDSVSSNELATLEINL